MHMLGMSFLPPSLLPLIFLPSKRMIKTYILQLATDFIISSLLMCL